MTVISDVMSVPELVMNDFAPLRTQESPTWPARVLTAPASEPPPGSVRPKAASRSPAAQLRQPVLLLLVGAEAEHRHRAQADPGLERDGHRRVDPGELLERDAQREVVPVHAAVLARERQAEQAHPAHRGDDRVGEGVPLVVVPDDRGHLLAGEGLDGLAQILVLGGQGRGRQHGESSSVPGALREGLDSAGGCRAAEDVGHPAGDVDELVQVDARGDAESVEHPHEVFGGQVARGGFGVGTTPSPPAEASTVAIPACSAAYVFASAWP